MTDPTPVAFFNEAAREAASRALCDKYGHEQADWGLDWLDDVQITLTAALEALPERSKAILALAELSDEELVERVALVLAARTSSDGEVRADLWPVIGQSYRCNARAFLTALGLPVGQETTG